MQTLLGREEVEDDWYTSSMKGCRRRDEI